MLLRFLLTLIRVFVTCIPFGMSILGCPISHETYPVELFFPDSYCSGVFTWILIGVTAGLPPALYFEYTKALTDYVALVVAVVLPIIRSIDFQKNGLFEILASLVVLTFVLRLPVEVAIDMSTRDGLTGSTKKLCGPGTLYYQIWDLWGTPFGNLLEELNRRADQYPEPDLTQRRPPRKRSEANDAPRLNVPDKE